ncbi:hypothetical protein [uncultured Aquimarina sp.]|uniref:hypothetical protein n=1 Tax=uncultured Aquimarina sp. TaxID=575652 RepID=UPI00261AAE40|nr:hypothetical protein [uncultured Aquimarina sp.]
MSNTLKFHLISCAINFVVILLAAYINQFIVELIDPMTFVKRGSDFDFIWLIYVFGCFWIYTGMVYIFKNTAKHVYTFAAIGFIVLYVRVFINYYTTGSDFLLFLTNGLQETSIFILVSAILIHISQLIIGKKFLPNRYKK